MKKLIMTVALMGVVITGVKAEGTGLASDPSFIITVGNGAKFAGRCVVDLAKIVPHSTTDVLAIDRALGGLIRPFSNPSTAVVVMGGLGALYLSLKAVYNSVPHERRDALKQQVLDTLKAAGVNTLIAFVCVKAAMTAAKPA